MATPFTSDSAVLALFRENLLQGIFRGPLFPELKFRGLYDPEPWGEQALSVLKTAHGPMRGKATPRQFKQDPIPGTYDNEFWPVTIAQYADSLDVDKLAAGLSPLDMYRKDTEALALGAGTTLLMLSRYPAYNVGLFGQTVTSTVGAGTTKRLLKLNGFSQTFNSSGQLQDVSAANPLTAYFWNGATWDAVSIIGYTPDTAGDHYGPGTILLAATYTSTSRQPLVAAHASAIVFEGGGHSVDDVGSTDYLTGDSIIEAAARLRDTNVPTFSDGFYHAHLSTKGMKQLLADPQVQLLMRGQGLDKMDSANPYVTGKVPVFSGVALFENTEAAAPGAIPATYGEDGDLIAAESVNATSVPLHTALVVGAGGGIEYWREPLKSMRNSGASTGEIGAWSLIGQSGAVTDVERIELAVRFPINRLLDVESLSYSYMGAFSWRTDYRSKKPGAAYADLPSTCRAAYKRVVPIVHAG